jgi:predicted DNA-binding WGR domain protein
MQIRLEFRAAGSAKFWQLSQAGKGVTVTFGKVGTQGQTQLRLHDTPAAARADAEKQVQAKLKKGYQATGAQATKLAVSTGAKKQVATSKPSPAQLSPAQHTALKFPFLFVGHGYGTSYKCLECFIAFVEAPNPKQREAIVAALPLPLRSFARFSAEVLHFGSDDGLESYIFAAYDPAYAQLPFKQALKVAPKMEAEGFKFPPRKLWAAFCDDFERAMHAVQKICKIRMVIKPDDGEAKNTLWHKWSVLESYRVAQWATLKVQKPSKALSWFFMNLLQAVLPEESLAARRLSPAVREIWLMWLDVLMGRGDQDLTDEYAERVQMIVDAYPKSERTTALAKLSKKTILRL